MVSALGRSVESGPLSQDLGSRFLFLAMLWPPGLDQLSKEAARREMTKMNFTSLPHHGFLFLSVLIAGLQLCCPAQENVWTVKGRIVDGGRKPIAGAKVALIWTHKDDKWQPFPSPPAISDKDGKFVLKGEVWREIKHILAYSPDGTRAGMRRLDSSNDVSDIQIVLAPTVEVKGEIVCQELGVPPWFGFQVLAGIQGDIILTHYKARGNKTRGIFRLRLPPGDYSYEVYGPSIVGKRGRLKVRSRAIDLGQINVEASVVSKRRGKMFPEWHVTAARGVAPNKTAVSDLRGKWVLVEFWGYW